MSTVTGRENVEEERGAMPAHLRRAVDVLEAERRPRGRASAPVRSRIVRRQSRPASVVHLVHVDDGTEPARRYYVKTLHATPETRNHRLAEVSTEYQILCALTEHFAPLGVLGVIRPVALLAEDLTLVTEEFPGQSLEAVINELRWWWSGSRRRRVADLCDTVGSWLWHFQEFTARPGARFDVAELVDYCDERLRVLVENRHSGVDGSRARSTLDRLQCLGEQIDDGDLAVTGRHNDFRPEHVLVRDGRLVVLDFTGFTHGPRLYDFMKFWMRLEYQASGVLGKSRDLAVMQEGFRRGYGRWVDLTSPLARILRGANLLDTMSDLVEAPPRPWRRLLDRRWYERLRRQLETV